MQTVLIVDDSKLLRTKLRMILEALEYRVVGEAADGREAIALYETLLPDFVTMDIEMPHCNGIEAVESILKEHPELKVIWMSTIQNQKTLQEVRRHCQSVVVPKPFDETKVKEGIEKLKSLRRQRPE